MISFTTNSMEYITVEIKKNIGFSDYTLTFMNEADKTEFNICLTKDEIKKIYLITQDE
jgi:hypothetical protein